MLPNRIAAINSATEEVLTEISGGSSDADSVVLHIYAYLAEKERSMIADRTRAAWDWRPELGGVHNDLHGMSH